MDKKILTIIELIRNVNTNRSDLETAEEILDIIPEDSDYSIEYDDHDGWNPTVSIVFDKTNKFDITVFDGNIFVDGHNIKDLPIVDVNSL